MKSLGKEHIYRFSVDGQQGRFSKLQLHNNTSKNNLGQRLGNDAKYARLYAVARF